MSDKFRLRRACDSIDKGLSPSDRELVGLCYCSNGGQQGERTESTYLPECGPEKGQGVIPCRAMLHVPHRTMRLYPTGGTFLHVTDGTGRSSIERRLTLKFFYMSGFSVSAKVARASRHQREYCLLNSAMSHQPWATMGPDDKVELNTYPAFLGCDVGWPRYSQYGQHDSVRGRVPILSRS